MNYDLFQNEIYLMRFNCYLLKGQINRINVISGLEVITVPVLARVWQEIASHSTGLAKSKVAINEQLLQLKPFTVNLISSMNGLMKAYQVDFNQYVLEVLHLNEAMLKLGFYDDEEEII